jgi:exonuclease III
VAPAEEQREHTRATPPSPARRSGDSRGRYLDIHAGVRDQHPGATDLFTWWAPWRELRAKNVGWRIDFVLASAALARSVTSCVVRKEVLGSDHAPVVVELDPSGW